jgi:hypothetical protein
MTLPLIAIFATCFVVAISGLCKRSTKQQREKWEWK